MKIRLFIFAITVALLLSVATVTFAQENTFVFIEQAAVADSWETLLGLMQQYGLHGFDTGCYADIVGDLSIGRANAEVVMILCGDHEDTTVYETTGYDYDIWFEAQEYDTVKEALLQRYGAPEISEDADDALVWHFRQTEVCFWRKSLENAVLTYYLQPFTDETKPVFPAHQSFGAIPALTQGEMVSSFEEDGFIAFMEQASLSYSRGALGKIGVQYGLTMAENEQGARLSGSLSVGEYVVSYVDAFSPEGLPVFDCYAYFELDAYDTLKAALGNRYGAPVTMWDSQEGFVWHFAEADVLLKRSVTGMAEVNYVMQSFRNDFYPSFPPLPAEKVDMVPAQLPQSATGSEANALAFMEQALQMDSWAELKELGNKQGITLKKELDHKYHLSGNLLVGGFSAIKGDAYHFNSSGFDCKAEFESDAYDAVLDALINRYGAPKLNWEPSPLLVWNFESVSVQFYRPYLDGGVTLYYSSNESLDES